MNRINGPPPSPWLRRVQIGGFILGAVAVLLGLPLVGRLDAKLLAVAADPLNPAAHSPRPANGTKGLTRAFRVMTKSTCSSVPRYLVIQAGLAVVVGVAIGGLMLGADIVAAAGPGDVLIFFIGAITTFFPLVFATAIGLLSLEGNE